MAELATIARPYADALFKAVGGSDAQALKAQLNSLAALAADEGLRQFADNPKVTSQQVFDLIAGIAVSKGLALDVKLANLLQAVLENGRLSALPEVATQFQALVNGSTGVSDALIQSAFPIEGAALAELVATLEKRFAAKLNAKVELAPELIGGVRVVVGDEVLDTSVKARLEQMKVALTA
ncbi:F0F1 ATP synthase subunit delta [Rubrivivax rivuli]|jgi:F-type H+-transporting ATPase subunit delta|uniref:ATP synthase subunit delta n=1 Tax=Rubrivivax rivuli TaxID=1862385 RepID=A0A437RS54_9BURK|nr:F0F1 ATP synthase subunit delta [Rubrivivax rivuli]RVU49583.1 F0F1 ATP synthase subunit delta [Rubrivivax rivuli]